MKHFRTLTALLLVLVLALVPLAGVLAEGEPVSEEWVQIPLCGPSYAIMAPAGYTEEVLTEEEYEMGLLSYFVNSDIDIYISVFRYPADNAGFKAFAETLCEEYEGFDFTYTESQNIEEPSMATYRCEGTADEDPDTVFSNQTLAFEADGAYMFVELWYLKDTGLDEMAEKMLGSFCKAEYKQIALGSSPYFVTVPQSYYFGEITSEEAARGLCTYCLSDNLLLDFDVYENVVSEDLTLADVAKQLCTMDKGSDLKENTINGITVYTFNGHDEYDGIEYDTITAVLDSTNDSIIAIVCWLDNGVIRDAAMQLLNSITTMDQMLTDVPMQLRIGSSDYAITLPTTFAAGYVPEEEFNAEGYAACYFSPYALFDIDLYQCLKEDELPTLAEFTEKDAEDYSGTEIALDEQINGVTVTSYRSVETYDNIEYKCATYTFEDELYYYQLCFYWIDNDAAEDVEEAMATLAPIEKTTMKVGPYTAAVPTGLTSKTLDYTDQPDLTATRYEHDQLTFTVYEMAVADKPYTLEQMAEQEVAYYEGTGLAYEEINGIPVAYYYYTKTDAQHNQYAILTYCMETPDGYMDIDFVINDYVGMFRSLDIVRSLTQEA